MDEGAQFCPSCGAPATTTANSSSPPTPGSSLPTWTPPSPYSMNPTFTDADVRGIGKLKTAALFGIIGLVVTLVVGSVASSLVGLSVASSGIDIVGFVVGIVSIILFWSAFKTLVGVDNRFSTPAKLVLGLFAGLALLIIALIIILAGFGSLTISGTTVSGSGLGLVLGGAAVALIAVVALIVGIIGLIMGLWRTGKRYNETLLKVGGILFIIPFLDIVAPILVYLGARNAERKVGASNITPPSTTTTM